MLSKSLLFLALCGLAFSQMGRVGRLGSVSRNAQPKFTYYVDSSRADDSGNGLTPATAKKTIAAVNALTLTAGQSVGFKRGGTWRETLTPGQSGSSGNLITFGAYGSGSHPLILGSVAKSSAGDWTQDSIAGTYTLQQSFSLTGNTNAQAVARFQFQTGGSFTTTTGYTLTRVDVGIIKGAGSPLSHPVTAYLYANNAGLPGTLLATSTNTRSDSVTATGGTPAFYEWDFPATVLSPSTKYWVSLGSTKDSTNYVSISSKASTGEYTVYYDNTTWAVWGTGTDYQQAMKTYYTVPGASYYYATVTTAPNFVVRDGVMMTSVATQAEVVDVNKWWWDSTNKRVYVWDSGANPTVGGHTFEIPQRDTGITVSAQSYLRFQGIDVSCTNRQSVWFTAAAGGDASYNTYTGGHATLAGYWALQISGAAATYARGNTFSFNEVDHVVGLGIDVASTAANLHAVDNVVTGNVVHDVVYGALDLTESTSIEADIGSVGTVVSYNTVYNLLQRAIVVHSSQDSLIHHNVGWSSLGALSIIQFGAEQAASGTQFYHNTFYGMAGANSIYQYGNCPSFTSKNNILTATDANQFVFLRDPGTYTGTAMDYNEYFGTPTNKFWYPSTNYQTLSAWFGATGFDQHSNLSDPLFVDGAGHDFTLQAGSPAIGTGVYISGVSTANPPNIGAK